MYRDDSKEEEEATELWQQQQQEQQQHKWEVPEVILKYRLINNVIPRAVVPYYAAYEGILKRSEHMRRRWNDQPGKEIIRANQKASPCPDQPFEYTRLQDTRSIRLLHVQPGEVNDPINCSMQNYSLKDLPPYTAISYSWLVEHGWTRIACDAQELLIQRTLEQLLLRLRRRFKGCLTLWIDSVCISDLDQPGSDPQTQLEDDEDDEKAGKRRTERESQVQMMDEIYRSADQVIIWLGEEDEHTREIDELLATIDGNHSPSPNGDGKSSTKLPWLMDPKWSLLAQFLDRQWFSRAWVLQELVLARRSLAVCGGYAWEWRRIEAVFDAVLALQRPDSAGLQRRLREDIFGVARNLRRGGRSLEGNDDDDDNQSQSSSYDLLNLLTAARGLRASREMDKVFALLPLCRDRLGIEVDYAQSVQRLYVVTATKLLRTGRLELLRHAGEGAWNNVAGLPSWVPDWSCDNRTAVLPGLRPTEMRSSEVPAFLSVRDKELTLEVIRRGTVQRTGVPWAGNQSRQDDDGGAVWGWDVGKLAYMRLRHWHSMLWPRTTYEPSSTDESIDAAFMRTITADSVALPSCCGEWGQAYEGFQARLWEKLSRGTGLFYSERVNRGDDFTGVNEAVRTLCYKRTFFLTRDRCMGLGPFFTLPGDWIVDVPGTGSRFVVRRTLRGRFKLVGECYVHGYGMMDGDEEKSGLHGECITIV